MMHLLESSSLATGALVAAAWQGMLLVLVAWAGLRLLPKTPAGVRFAVWFGVFLVVAGLPLLALRSGGASAAARGRFVTLDVRWSLWIASIWGVASAWRAAVLAVGAVRLRGLWKRAVPVEFLRPTHRDETALTRAHGRQAEVCLSDEVDRPSVIGFWAPRILIPEWLLEKLTPEELEQVVLHEAEHLGRGDDWLNLLQKIAMVIFPLNPALAWVERRLCFERELACDERVLRTTGAPIAYAVCLARVAEERMGHRGRFVLALGALGRESELGRRVMRILERGERMSAGRSRTVMAGAAVALLAGVVGLARVPEVVGFGGPVREASVQGSGVRGFGVVPVVYRTPTDLTSPAELSGTPNRDEAAMNGAPRNLGGLRVERTKAKANAGVLHFVQDDRRLRRDTKVVKVVKVMETQEAPRFVLVRTEFVVSAGDGLDVQRYAAVPVRGGWLLVQL